ncbi:MAG: acetate--CoA ligase family protein, partial [Nitrospiraceae bacterium]
IVVPQQGVLDAAKGSLKAGAKSLIVISSGFKETGSEGASLEKELAGMCRTYKARLLGPNCLGVINTAHRFNASFAGKMPGAGGISVFSQSGALCTSILDMAAIRHLGLAKLFSIGNKADVTEVDIINFLANDDQTKVIIGYLEDISTGDDFMKAAERASSKKPLIILKAGDTAAGRKAASSHTGVLAGSETAYGAAFKRSGVIRAESFDALFDFAAAFALQPVPAGKKVLIITNAGGPGTVSADAVERAGLEVASLDSNVATALRGRLPDAASVGNPVDVLGDADPSRYAEAIKAAQNDESVDGIIVILTPQAMTRPAETARAIAENSSGSKPVLSVFMGGKAVLPGRSELAAHGLPYFYSPERAVGAMKAMYEHSVWKQRPPRIVTRFRVNRRRVERVINRSVRTNRHYLGEVKAKDILRAYGFRTPEGYLTVNSEEAVEAAERVGFPVAMKIVSPDIVHKTDLGGVRLNVASSDEVQDTFELIMLHMLQRAPDASIDGIYVEKMADRGLEVILGMTRDAQFGPMLMFGLGGIFVEVMKDVTFYLAPITQDEATLMLKSTRSYEILKGKRGQKGVDLETIAIGIQKVSQLATDFPQITELDINPFIVGKAGSGSYVADARITLSKA